MWTDVWMSGLVGVALNGWAVNDTRPVRPLNEWCLRMVSAENRPDETRRGWPGFICQFTLLTGCQMDPATISIDGNYYWARSRRPAAQS